MISNRFPIRYLDPSTVAERMLEDLFEEQSSCFNLTEIIIIVIINLTFKTILFQFLIRTRGCTVEPSIADSDQWTINAFSLWDSNDLFLRSDR